MRLAWLLLAGCCALPALEVKVLETVKIAESHYYGYFPSLHRLASGELLTTVKMDADAHHIESNFWGFHLSRDRGRTWGFRNTNGMVYEGESAYTREPLPDGSVRFIAGYGLPSEGDDYRKVRMVSVKIFDHGESILFQRDVVVELPKPSFRQPMDGAIRHFASIGPGKLTHSAFVFFSGTLIPSRDGGWITTLYGKLEGDRYFRTFVVRSDRQGKRWQYVTTVAGDEAAVNLPGEKDTEGFTEPRMIRLPDGRLLLAVRRGSNHLMFRAWSSDDGRSWTKPESIGFKGVKPALWLMRSGVLALSTGRPDPVTVRFSRDGGQTWSNATELYSKPGTRYTDLVEVQPNRLLVVYDHVPGEWGVMREGQANAMNEVFGAYLEVK